MKVHYLLLVLAAVFMAACSDETDKVKGDHVWKEQTDMIDKAKDVEVLINGAALQQRQQIEEKTQ
jgi:outer membrane biogenesis lipoprotein LolB